MGRKYNEQEYDEMQEIQERDVLARVTNSDKSQ